MESQTKIKNIAPIGALIIIVIVGIVFIVFRGAEPVSAPTTDTADTLNATSTATSTNPSVYTPAPGQPVPVVIDEQKVIKGEGFTATVRQVTAVGETPVIKSFAVRQKEKGGCLYTWEAESAVSCNIMNVVDKTGIKDVPIIGAIQTNDVSSYQLTCKGSGGKVTTSEVVACK
jgi:hypothetical protein